MDSAAIRRHLADYAMMFDLIGKLSGFTSEREAVDKILQLFSSLCAPSNLAYLSFSGGEPGELRRLAGNSEDDAETVARLSSLQGDYAWTSSGNGFAIRITSGDETLGVLELDGIAFRGQKEHYLKLALALVQVVALTITNARTFQQLEEANNSLAQERERLDVTLKSIGDAVIATDTEQRITLMNEVAQTLTGWTHEEAIGRPLTEVLEIINEKTGRPARNPVETALRTGETVGLENHTTLIARGGARVAIADSCSPIRDKAGNVIGAVLVFRDVTAEHRAQEALKASEERFRGVYDGAAVGIALVDSRGRLMQANRAFQRMLGYEGSELSGMSIADITHPDDLDHNIELHHELFDGKRSHFQLEKRYIRSDGRIMWGRLSASLIKEGTGQAPRVIAVIQDISEQKRAEDELREALALSQRRALEVSALLRGSRAVLEHTTFEESARAIFESCRSLIGATAGYVALLTESGDKNEVVFVDPGPSEYESDPAQPIPLSNLQAEVYRTRRPAYCNDFFARGFEESIFSSNVSLDNLMLIPLVIGKKTVGLMGVANKPRGFIDADTRIGMAFGELAAVSFQKSRSLKMLQHSEERFRSIAQSANDAIICANSRGEILLWNRGAEKVFGFAAEDIIGRQVTDIMPERFRERHLKGLGRIASQGARPRVIGKTVELMGLRKEGDEFPLELSLASWKSGQDVFFAGIARDITERKRAEEALAAERERLAVTLRSTGDGVIATDTEERVVLLNDVAQSLTGWTQEQAAGRPLTEVFKIVSEKTGKPAPNPVAKALKTGEIVGLANHTALIDRKGKITPIADSCAPIRNESGAIIGAVLVFRDITEQNRAEALSDALNRIYATLGSTLDLDKIMPQVIKECAEAIGAESAGIAMREGSAWVAKHIYGLPNEVVGKSFSGPQPALELLGPGRGPIIIKDARCDDRIDREIADVLGIKSLMILPLAVREEVMGALSFNFHSKVVAFDPGQIDFATKLSSALSFAIENARLYAAEHAIADTLQEAVLKLPRGVDGLEIGHLYRSATESARVGGDFYDLFEMDGSRVGIVVGDVSGKGVEAASLTSLVKTTIRAYARIEQSPASILAKTNILFCECSEAATFVTVFFGVLDKEGGTISYCCAGHPPAILKRRQGIDLLLTNSPAMGVSESFEFVEDTTLVSEGETLFLYTDGAIEAKKGEALFGEERLVDLIQTSSKCKPDELVREVFAELSDFSGNRLRDDVALLTLRLRAGSRSGQGDNKKGEQTEVRLLTVVGEPAPPSPSTTANES